MYFHFTLLYTSLLHGIALCQIYKVPISVRVKNDPAHNQFFFLKYNKVKADDRTMRVMANK